MTIYDRRIALLNRVLMQVLIILFLLSATASLWINLTNNGGNLILWAGDWLQNFNTEIIGIFLTVVIIERLLGGAQKELQELKQLHEEVIPLLRSTNSDVAKAAAEKLKEHGLHWAGSLQDINLEGVNLAGIEWRDAHLHRANLRGANLQRIDLRYSKLQGAVLESANLQGAELRGVNLEGANLRLADLRSAELGIANLRQSDLSNANLGSVDLLDADLCEARLEHTLFDNKTRLPDMTWWTPETDMRRFTDPQHPDFWRSAYWRSPAWWLRGKC